jgi:hypothetical protein
MHPSWPGSAADFIPAPIPPQPTIEVVGLLGPQPPKPLQSISWNAERLLMLLQEESHWQPTSPGRRGGRSPPRYQGHIGQRPPDLFQAAGQVRPVEDIHQRPPQHRDPTRQPPALDVCDPREGHGRVTSYATAARIAGDREIAMGNYFVVGPPASGPVTGVGRSARPEDTSPGPSHPRQRSISFRAAGTPRPRQASGRRDARGRRRGLW